MLEVRRKIKFVKKIMISLLKKNRLEKLASPVKRSTQLLASTKQTFAWQSFIEVSGISIIFSREIDMGESIFEKI